MQTAPASPSIAPAIDRPPVAYPAPVTIPEDASDDGLGDATI
jgi:hypothetical protein